MSKELLAGIVNEQQSRIYAEESEKQERRIKQLQTDLTAANKRIRTLQRHANGIYNQKTRNYAKVVELQTDLTAANKRIKGLEEKLAKEKDLAKRVSGHLRHNAEIRKTQEYYDNLQNG